MVLACTLVPMSHVGSLPIKFALLQITSPAEGTGLGAMAVVGEELWGEQEVVVVAGKDIGQSSYSILIYRGYS